MAQVPLRKNGQRLGRKGLETRTSLLDATRELLNEVTPLHLTASSIAKRAGSSTATFYMYFNDVADILWSLCAGITQDTVDLFANDSILRDPARLDDEAPAFIRSYAKIWRRHEALLLYRNLQADMGNPKFNALLTKTGLPILMGITDRIISARGADRITRRDANAEAVVVVSAMDRLAGAVALYPTDSVIPDVLWDALGRVLANMLRPVPRD